MWRYLSTVTATILPSPFRDGLDYVTILHGLIAIYSVFIRDEGGDLQQARLLSIALHDTTAQ